MPSLPPLDCLRFFEVAARRESFAKAAEELHVTPSAVAHRVKMLERHLGAALFVRVHLGVRLTGRGKAYLNDVQRILAEISVISERRHGESGMPRLADFNLAHPGVVIELETNHRGVDPAQRDFDIWLAYIGKTAAPDLSRASGFRLYKVVSQYIVACGVNHSGNRLRRKLTEMLYQASLNLHSASDPTRAT